LAWYIAVSGRAHQRIGIGAVGREHTDTNAAAQLQLVLLDAKRRAEGKQQLVRDRQRVAAAGEIGQAHDELVSAEPRDTVTLAHTGLQARGGELQQLVADRVTERVVHALETVEIDEQHGHLALIAAGVQQRLLDAVAAQQAVRQAGQRIVLRQVADVLLGALSLADIAKEGDHRAIALATVLTERDLDIDPPAVAVLGRELHSRGQCFRLCEQALEAGAIRAIEHQSAEGCTDQLLAPVTQDAFHRMVAVKDQSAAIERHDPVRGCLGQRAILRLLIAHDARRAIALGQRHREQQAADREHRDEACASSIDMSPRAVAAAANSAITTICSATSRVPKRTAAHSTSGISRNLKRVLAPASGPKGM
jgi:hypothetical protein